MKADIVRVQKLNADFSRYPVRLRGLQEQVEAIARWAELERAFGEAAHELKKLADTLDYDVGILNQMNEVMRRAMGMYAGNEECLLQFLEETQAETKPRMIDWVNIPDWVFDLVGNQENAGDGR